MSREMSVVISISLPLKIADRLQKLAEARTSRVSSIARVAIHEYTKKHLSEISEKQKTLKTKIPPAKPLTNTTQIPNTIGTVDCPKCGSNYAESIGYCPGCKLNGEEK